MLYQLSYARDTSKSIQGRAAPQGYPTLNSRFGTLAAQRRERGGAGCFSTVVGPLEDSLSVREFFSGALR